MSRKSFNEKKMKKGTTKVSVLYPDGEGKTFDMDYYCNKHIPMITELLGDALLGVSVEKGIAGGAPGSTATYPSMGHLYFESVEQFQNAFGPNADKIMGDVPNYTNIEPIMQISEVMV